MPSSIHQRAERQGDECFSLCSWCREKQCCAYMIAVSALNPKTWNTSLNGFIVLIVLVPVREPVSASLSHRRWRSRLVDASPPKALLVTGAPLASGCPLPEEMRQFLRFISVMVQTCLILNYYTMLTPMQRHIGVVYG